MLCFIFHTLQKCLNHCNWPLFIGLQNILIFRTHVICARNGVHRMMINGGEIWFVMHAQDMQ